MEDLQGAAVRVTPERGRADEWAVVLAATKGKLFATPQSGLQTTFRKL